MTLSSYFRRKREEILKRQTDKIKIPTFKESSIIRRRLVFSGKVQGVGFRFESQQISNRLGLKGWVRNKSDGRVEAEVQGKEEEIKFLIDYLKSLKRIRIEKIDMEAIPLSSGETEFKILI